MLHKIFLAAAACLTLSACFQTQLKGSVGGAEVSITPLSDPGNILVSRISKTPEDWIAQRGEDGWEKWSPLTQLLNVGTARFDKQLPPLEPGKLYLVTATGGLDYDPELNSELSDQPEQVQGSWHVIASGQRIIDGNIKISALTEALYRQQLAVLDSLDEQQIADRLDAAATLVVGDADDDGDIDYDDVLRFNRTLDKKFFLGRIKALDALAEGIIAGQPAASLDALAERVLGSTQVEMVFDAGTVIVETYNWDSPITAANFLGYVRSGYYDQVLVHRAINNFMIQIGLVSYDGLNEDGLITWSIKSAGPSIVNESSNGISNRRGTLSMARTSDPNSASSQFFINQANNSFLDYGSNQNPDGYAVFGRVLSGMDVVDAIAAEPTTNVSGIGADVPSRGVLLESVREL